MQQKLFCILGAPIFFYWIFEFILPQRMEWIGQKVTKCQSSELKKNISNNKESSNIFIKLRFSFANSINTKLRLRIRVVWGGILT